MRHLSLFTGIGGFELAASWVWGEEWEPIAFCEIDKFCQKVLRKHWPDVQIIEDVREVTLEKIMAYTFINRCGTYGLEAQLCKENQTFDRKFDRINNGTIDLLTGGFPCQPFSCAGKRQGSSDTRFLWPEMLRIIHETAPAWIIAENVPGLLSLNGGLEFESVYASLENEGYEVQAFVIPACAVNAPHRRDRVWIVGYSEKHRNQKLSQPYCREDSTGAMRSILAHEPSGNAGEWWNSESGFCRVANGISSRVDRLRSLGNAIVPQVAAQIMRAIKSASPTGASS